MSDIGERKNQCFFLAAEIDDEHHVGGLVEILLWTEPLRWRTAWGYVRLPLWQL